MPRAWLLLFVLLAPTALPRERYQQARPVKLERDGERWAERTLSKLSLEQKVGQLFMVWSFAEFVNVHSAEFQRLQETIHKYHVGGFGLTVRSQGSFLYRNWPHEAAMVTNRLQEEAEVPLLFAADFERGASMRLYGSTQFPHAMAFGAAGKPEYAAEFGRITAQESRALGVHWNWFPVADVNSNPQNPIINTRAFSEDPQQVSQMVAAYIRAARQAGMLTTAKHFPGHGDTATDSHVGLAQVDGDRARLEAVELPPFRAAIEAGVDSVMVAHVTMPALEPDPNKVATISERVVTGLLQNEMGFQGLVVTDALDMGALTSLFAGAENPAGEAAVQAFLAGNDMLLIPADFEAAYRGVLEAVRSGRISQERLDRSVRKVLRAKASVGLHKARLVEVAAVARLVGTPENVAFGQRVADEAVTLVRENGLLPLRAGTNGTAGGPGAYQGAGGGTLSLAAVIFTDDVRKEDGRVLERELKLRVPQAAVFYVDERTAGAMTSAVMNAADRADAVIAAVYMIPTSGRRVAVNGALVNTVSLTGAPAQLLDEMLRAVSLKTAVVALGNPYVAADFPAVENYLCTFSHATVSEVSAVKALFGEMPVRGRLPVSIPRIAARGAGLERPAVTQRAASTGTQQ